MRMLEARTARLAIGAVAVWVLILFTVFAPAPKPSDPNDIRPVIQFVDAFIAEHGRCPNFIEFFNDEPRTCFIESGTDRVRRLGGTEPNDYILTRISGRPDDDTSICYRSWEPNILPAPSGP